MYHTTQHVQCRAPARWRGAPAPYVPHHVSDQVRLHRTYHNTRVGTGAPAPYVPHHVTCRTRCTCTVRTTPHHVSDQVYLHCTTQDNTSRTLILSGQMCCTFLCVHSFCVCVCVCARPHASVRVCVPVQRDHSDWLVLVCSSSTDSRKTKLCFTYNYMQSRANFCVIHDVRHHHHQVHVQYLAIVTGAENPEEVEEILRKRVSRILVQERPQGRRRSNVMEARKTATHVRLGVRRGHFDLLTSTAPAGRQADVCVSFPRNAFSLGLSPDAKHGRFLPELWCYLEENERRERGGGGGGGTEGWWEGTDNAKMEVKLVWINLKFCGRAKKLVFGGGGGGGGVGRCARVYVCVGGGGGGGVGGRNKSEQIIRR